jgi:hypothetical protein
MASRKPLTFEQKEKAKQRAKEWYLKNKEKIQLYKKEWSEVNKVEISMKRKQRYVNNKETELKKNSEYRKQNCEQINQQRKKYRENNKELVKQQDNTYRIKNKEKINEYRKTRKEGDVLFKLKCNARSHISMILKKRGYTKKSKCHEIIGCSYEEFKLHLENKFEPWMNWENRGLYNGDFNYGWDIDHIVPLSSATTENELLLLFHYTNCQPLCSKINRDIKKGII